MRADRRKSHQGRKNWLGAVTIAMLAAIAFLVTVASAGATESVTRTFVYTGAEQAFIVPAGVSKVGVVAIGGSGEGYEGFPGGEGARVTAELTVTPGEGLYVEVGQGYPREEKCTETFPCECECYGGGATDVRTSPRSEGLSPDPRLVVAGGGGGSGESTAAGEEFYGGGAGGAAGEAGQPNRATRESNKAGGGQPGTQTTGGTGGFGHCALQPLGEEFRNTPGGNGGLEAGGYEGFCSRIKGIFGGGGGAGYYGGGGGGAGESAGGGGGGGSSRVPAGGSVTLTNESPHVQISFLQAASPSPAVLTTAASEVVRNSARLNAFVDPEGVEVTTCRFEYGTTEAYKSTAACSPSPGSGTNTVAVSAPVTSLNPATTYHYRIVAANRNGTSYGHDRIFKTTLHNPPVVVGISPEEGAEGGGTAVTIVGSEFEEAEIVRFGSTAASSCKLNSTESITAMSPAGVGAVDVTVTTASGTSARHSADVFTYGPPPTIKKLSPKKGPTTGGTTVDIGGKSLKGTTTVKFGSTAATDFKVNSDTSLTAVSPPGAVGTMDVTVTTPSGTSAITRKDHFKYKSPRK